MRITNSLFYATSAFEHQNAMKKMYDINNQMASGMKIQNSYEDSGVFVDTMRLNYEIATLEQTKETSSKAQTFAQNTDATMNQFSDALGQFKTKLIQAANSGINSLTSLNAIADELSSLKQHMISVANTSINGQYLFSGTSLLQKPIQDDGSYVGNANKLEAIVGSGVEIPYNIDGQSLFLGADSDYNRVVSTNVSMLNQTKLYSEIMGNGEASEEVYLNANDTIRDMVGDADDITTNNANTVFYLSGRKSDGSTFSNKISLSSTSKISDLLESIGNAYGNTSLNRVVDVSMNDNGQIEIKDLKQGNQLIEMNLFAAVDRSATSGVGNADQTDIDSLLAYNNVDIITFNKSDFVTINAAASIASRTNIYVPDIYSVGYPMQNANGDLATASSLLRDFTGGNVTEIEINGTYFAVTGTTTVNDLLTEMNTQYPGVTSRIDNGQILVEQGTYVGSFSTILTARDTTAAPLDGSGNLVNAFSIPDSMNYTRRGFEKDGNELMSNISQIVKDSNSYATSKTKLLEVAGATSLDGKTLALNYADKNGIARNASINLSNAGSTFSIDLNNDGDTTDVNESFSIFDADGNATKADEMTYQQLLDVISMATSSVLPTDGTPTGVSDGFVDFLEYNDALNSAKNSVETTLDYKGRISIKDKTASESKINFSMYDTDADTYGGTQSTALSFMANDAVTISNPTIDFFKDLDQMIEAVRTGNFRMGDNADDPRNIGIQNSISQLDHILDHVTKMHTKIGAYSNALQDSSDRATYLSLNVKTVRSSVIDVDTAEAYLQFNQISTSYQAMLSTIAKINSLSLLNYM